MIAIKVLEVMVRNSGTDRRSHCGSVRVQAFKMANAGAEAIGLSARNKEVNQLFPIDNIEP